MLVRAENFTNNQPQLESENLGKDFNNPLGKKVEKNHILFLTRGRAFRLLTRKNANSFLCCSTLLLFASAGDPENPCALALQVRFYSSSISLLLFFFLPFFFGLSSSMFGCSGWRTPVAAFFVWVGFCSSSAMSVGCCVEVDFLLSPFPAFNLLPLSLSLCRLLCSLLHPALLLLVLGGGGLE